MSIKIPYMRKDTSSTLVTISAATAAIALLLSSPILSFNVLLQPVQAANEPMTFRTPANNPAVGDYTLTFEAHGTNSSGRQTMSGTFQLTNDVTLNGNIESGTFTNNTNGGLSLSGIIGKPYSGAVGISTQCSTDDLNMVTIGITEGGGRDTGGNSNGPIECTLSSSQGGGGGGNATTTTAQPSSSMTDGTTNSTQDSDRDGIPDSSDRCTHNSEHRCFKEGDTSSGATHEQQPSSSSSSSGNQTR